MQIRMTKVRTVLAVAASFIFVTLIGSAQAWASKRVAMVIGNGAYEHVPALPNPTNDAHSISASLKQVGFEVTLAKDLTYQQMRLALRAFSDKAIGSDIALIYYAGHGIEVDKHNYLVPTDARLKKDLDVEFEALSLEQLNLAVSGAKGLKMILLDACRDNPFAQSMTRTIATRSIGRGLAKVEPVDGSLVSFAAKEGTVASDGVGKNSPYTSALIKHIVEPGLDIQLMFRKVRDSVMAETGGIQEPFTYASLPGKNIYLTPPVEKQTQTASLSTGGSNPPLIVPTPVNDQAEISYWVSIVNLNSKDLFQSYLDKYPNGQFAEIAKFRVNQIEGKQRSTLESKVPPKTDNNTQVASLSPAATTPKVEQPAPKAEVPVTRSMIRNIQTQLNRVGCSVGRADGLWGKASIRGLKNYTRHSGAKFPSLQPSQDLLDNVSAQSVRICPAPVVKQAKSNPKPKATNKRSVTPQKTTKSTRRKSSSGSSAKRQPQRQREVVQEEVVIVEEPRRSSRRRGQVVEEVIIERPRQRRRVNPGKVIINGIIGGVLNSF